MTSRSSPGRMIAGTVGAVALLALGLTAYGWQTSGAYLTPVSGVWLALGRDVSTGIFYRDLASGMGYGGTRYSPLYFTLIGLLMRAGASPLAAGWIVGLFSTVALIAGIYAVVRSTGASQRAGVLWAAAGIAPYFVQQTVFEVRSDVLAAAFNLLGFACVVRLWLSPERGGRLLLGATFWFTLAFATNIVSLVVPASVAMAFTFRGRWRTGWRLGLGVAGGVLTCLAATALLSGGRAITSWRACMFAGVSGRTTIAVLLGGRFLRLVSYSHFVSVLLVIVVLAVAAMILLDRRRPLAATRETDPAWLAGVVFAGVSLATGLTLSSPGTAASNQMVEWIEMCLVVLALVARRRQEMTRVVCLVVAALAAWASAQDTMRVLRVSRTPADRATAAARPEIVGMIAGSKRPILCENPIWPVLAGQRPYVLDPFALRVIVESRPAVFQDLRAKLDSQFFGAIVLQMDPNTRRGRGFYANLHLGWPVVERILANYRLDHQSAPDVWVYLPRPRTAPPTARRPSL